MKVVLDTNVLIAAFISPQGICHEVFELCIYNHSLIISDFILSEFQNKLETKFHYNKKEIAEITELLLDKFIFIKIKGTPINICRDKDDDNIIETAVSAKANIIITGDNDLLVLKKYKSVEIISPREFYNNEKGIS